MGTPEESTLTPDEAEQASTSQDDGAGTSDAGTVGAETATEPGESEGPLPQDTNASPFQQGFDAPGGGENSDALQPGETLSAFADRHRVPVNSVREANADQVDENGNLLANTTRLVVPQ